VVNLIRYIIFFAVLIATNSYVASTVYEQGVDEVKCLAFPNF
jgi:hypothetical protein